MSKSKDALAVKAVLEYLEKQNRPYSALDICNNLHKEYGKTAVVKACESLAESGKIREKAYGKQKVYVADQSKFPDVDENEIQQMDATIAQLTEKVQDSMECVRKLEQELKTLNSSMSTEQAKVELKQLEAECIGYKNKLLKLKEGGVIISPQEKERVYAARQKYVKEWRKRKRISNDILDAVLEGYPKSKKELYEEVGIETDEDNGIKPPER
ncbi:hypothetical protein ACJMK2_024329 [Sinanodonta woodiana]|uniref:Homologous-pairing protein 2 homolog n=1 Tax=Sinanodonta woodiana TaxID=1069815 RepID=A0ABD3T718_SINWO